MPLVHPDDQEATAQELAKLRQPPHTCYIEQRALTADGWRWLAWSNKAIFDAQGQVAGAAGVGRDITERKQAEQALQRSEQKFRSFVEQSDDAIVMTDERGQVAEWNRGAGQIFGLPRAQAMGRPLWELWYQAVVSEQRTPSLREQFQSLLAGLLSTGQGAWLGQPHEAEVERPDGSRRVVQTLVFPIQTDQGFLLGSISRDVTQQKQAQEALRRRLVVEQLATTMSTRFIRLPAQEIDDEITRSLADIARFVGAEVCYLNLYGHGGETLAARYEGGAAERFSYTVEVGSSLAHFAWAIAQLREGNIVDMPDVSHLPPEAAPTAQALSSYGVRSALTIPVIHEGQLVGSLGLNASEPKRWPEEDRSLLILAAHILCNILERRQADQANEQLRAQFLQAQKMEAVGRLTSGIAHDFNNLLTAINGFTELLQFDLAPDHPAQVKLERILDSGQRAASLVAQLMAFSRKQILEPKLFDLNNAVRGTHNLLRRVIGEDIELVTRLEPALWPVEADATQVEQVIVNLAVNARDAMPGGGRLTIETSNVTLDDAYAAAHLDARPGDHVMLAVSDTGTGMSKDVQAHLFEPFFTTKEVGKGTGLGLATVYGIVKQSGGNIWVYSELGIGTTFKVYLPRAQGPCQTDADLQTGADAPSGHETILVVDDNTGLRNLACQVLRRQRYHVLEASHGQQALQLAAECTGPIQLLLADVVMPGINVRQLADELRQSHPALKVLLMSGYADDDIVGRGVLEPGVAYLQKPFSLLNLARKVRTTLDSGEPQPHLHSTTTRL
jgi:PAS domain S-box-containing protein